MAFVKREREFAPSYWMVKDEGNTVEGHVKKVFDTANGEAVAIVTSESSRTRVYKEKGSEETTTVGDGAEVCLQPPAAIAHLKDMLPGTYVRVTYGKKNVKTKRGTAWAMTLEEDPDRFEAPEDNLPDGDESDIPF